jgi:hypothetical protein
MKNLLQILDDMEKSADAIEAFVASTNRGQLSHDAFLVAQHFPNFIRQHIEDIQKLHLVELPYPALPDADPVREDANQIQKNNANVSQWLKKQIHQVGKA